MKMKPKNYWSKEKCHNAALNCVSRYEFKQKENSAYNAARINKWLDEICSHMTSKGTHLKRCIYACEFSDNYVYVGLTYNLTVRMARRKTEKQDAVLLHQQKTGLIPTVKQLTEYIPKEKAKELEEFYKTQYENNGWNILNRAKTGGIGGNTTIWTKEKCREESLKYTIKNDFHINCASAYSSAWKHKWLDEICSHMDTNPQSHPIIWTKGKCHEEALKYKTRVEFSKQSACAYSSAKRYKWLNEVCSHMIELRKPHGYWTKDLCHKEALKYEFTSKFQRWSGSAYASAKRNNWLGEICSHMSQRAKK